MVIGFDASKALVNWAVVNKSGRLVSKGSCPNSPERIGDLLVALKHRYPSLSSSVESTGICHLAVTRAAATSEVPCRLLNPIQTKQFTKSTVRGTKTDKQDAFYIALLGLQGAGHVLQPVEQVIVQARAYLRLAHRLQAVHSKLELTRQYITGCGLDLDETALVTARQSIKDAVSHYRGIAANLLAGDGAVGLLETIPGIGPVIAMGIAAELGGNVARFRSPLQLVAYAGLDPRIRQSGMSSSTGRLTKRGSPYLRYWLFMAARSAEQHDPELRSAYQNRRNAGKSYTVATVAVSRKLVHRIYAVLKRGQPYEVRKDSTGGGNIST